jgi:TolB-like protein/Flp pilus assembly protein TadD
VAIVRIIGQQFIPYGPDNMKRCPECRRDYYNESLLFCLDDGTALLEGPSSGNEPATAILSEPPAVAGGLTPASESPTRAQIHTTDQTAILPTGTSDIVTKSRVFDKRLLAAPFLLAIIVLGGFFGYRYLKPAGGGQIESIAVMPFVNESGNADDEYLSDGITESLINSLSQIPNLRVIARTTVFRYKGRESEAQKAGKELGVECVLTGKVLRRGDRFIIQADLISVSDDSQMWGEHFTVGLADLQAVQTQIADKISQTLKIRLTGVEQERLNRLSTENPEAYRAYLSGYHYLYKFTDEDIKKSFEYFQQAIEKDRNYAAAYAGLAEAYVIGTLNTNPEEVGPKATAAARRSLAIDPTLADAHYAMALVSFRYNRDWQTAEREFQEAIRLKPSYAMAYDWYGYILAMQGRFDEALEQYRRGLETDPLSIQIITDIGTCHYWAHNFDLADAQLKKAIELDPSFPPAINYQVSTYAAQGRYAEALRLLDKFAASQGIFVAASLRGYVYAKSGRRKEALSVIDELKEQSKNNYLLPESFAYIYSGLGDNDQAIRWLEQSCRQSSLYLQSIKVEPLFDDLRNDPRFAGVVSCVGVPQ